MNNKRIVFPVVISIIVIVIAIIIFLIIGSSEKSRQENTSVIKLGGNSENASTANVADDTDDEEDDENVVDNDNENDTSNNTIDSDDDSIEFDGDEFYLDATKAFIAGLMDSEDMKNFIDNYVDIKAYVACYNVDADDEKFMEEYQSLSDDDDKVKEVGERFEKLSSDNEFKVKSISDPKTSGDDENISRVTVTLKKDDSTEKYRMIFYDNIVIYIADESGDSIIEFDD